jgi:hypothetical protein
MHLLVDEDHPASHANASSLWEPIARIISFGATNVEPRSRMRCMSIQIILNGACQ